MKWINLSEPIHESMTVYKNLDEKKPRLEVTRNFNNAAMHETTLHLPLHTGTHIDYPLHAIPGGKKSCDYALFPDGIQAYVLDLSENPPESIGPEHLQGIDLAGSAGLFIKTLKKPLDTFDFDFPYLNREGAEWLTQFHLKYVGTDQPGLERNQSDHSTHIQLLQKDILIIEGLNLSMLSQGEHAFLLFSLGIKDVDAEPLVVYCLES